MLLDRTTDSHLNFLLDGICRAIQLPASLYEDAEGKYEAVADWLARTGSPLARFDPEVFPQGSVRIGTTVRPRGRDEYDVDLVLLLNTEIDDAMHLYGLVRDRLLAHRTYAGILEEKKRCLRLNYAGQFHLDVLPARPAIWPGSTRLYVPDKQLRGWLVSDPKGYASWFLRIAEGERDRTLAKTEPLPELKGAEEKSPLQRTVQLFKRRRDVYFGGDEDSPPSVVLTTLATSHYRNQPTVLATLVDTLELVWDDIQRTQGILAVPNPTLPQEDFADAWDVNSYARFVRFVRDFQGELARLGSSQTMEKVAEQLAEMFGEQPTDAAYREYGKRLQARAGAGRLYVGAAGVSTAASREAVRPPPFRPYGS